MVLFSFDKELYEADLKKISCDESREEGRGRSSYTEDC